MLKYLQNPCFLKIFELFYYILASFLVQTYFNKSTFQKNLLSKFASYGIRTHELGITARKVMNFIDLFDLNFK